MKLGKVSIIIPVYNVEEYIDECINSCVNQTYKDIEIICVNDGSSDKSREHVEKFMEKYPNIILVNQENAGVVKARNKGIEVSTGEYIMFVDSDDYIDTNMVEVMIKKLVSSKCDAVKCNIDTTLQFLQFCKTDKEQIYKGQEYQEYIKDKLFLDNNIFSAVYNGIYKKELVGNFPSGFRLGEDVLFNAEYFLKVKSVVLIPDAMYHYRDNPESVTHMPSIKTLVNNLKHFNSYYYVEELLKSIEFDNKEDMLKIVAARNYAAYLRLMFQVYGVANFITSVKYSKKYYKKFNDVFDNVTYDEVMDIIVDSYHWSEYKVATCVEPFYKKQFLKSYIGYKYIYKRKKKRK